MTDAIDRIVAAGGPWSRPRWGGGVQRTRELDRVRGLPRRAPLAGVPDLTARYRAPGGTMALWPLQSAALHEAALAGGLFAGMGVGCGKTLTCQLLALAMGAQRAVLLVPPALRKQLAHELPLYARHFRLPGDALTVVAYSELSSRAGADVLERVQPDLVIADEAHCLRDRKSARTGRFLRYMHAHPEVRFCALSGSMANRSIRDWAHLAELALRAGSPVPSYRRSWQELAEWAEALDSSDSPRPPGMLLGFCDDAELADLSTGASTPQAAARAGFRRRVAETLGVVSSGPEVPGCSLVIRAWGYSPPEPVREALRDLRRDWALGADELTEAMQVAEKARQVALGFYYEWDWPEGTKDEEWLHFRAVWARCVRDCLRRPVRGRDTPALVAEAADRGELDVMVVEARQRWLGVASRLQPPTVARWLDIGAAEAAIAWAEAPEGPGIVWYSHVAFGEALAALGLPTFGQGEAAHAALIAEASVAGRSIACSDAHATGKNLQNYSRMLVTCPPANGDGWQQMLGRLVRPGQEADEVVADVALYTPELESAYRQALRDAEFVAQTQGNCQLLLAAARP